MLKEIIRALSKMKVPYSEMPMYFDRSKTAIYGWGQGKSPKNVTITQLYKGIDQCRSHYLSLDKDTFIKQLIYCMDIPETDQDDLWEEYVRRKETAKQDEGAYYQDFITDLLVHESPKPSTPSTAVISGDGRINASRVAIGGHHILAVKENGHVLSTGENESQQCSTYCWRNIVSVGAGWRYSAGLKKDGTCIVVGQNMIGNGEVFQWRDLTAIACGPFHIIALKKDGTAKAYGQAGDGQCAIDHWDSLRAVAAGNNHSVGLKIDGTVACSGKNDCGQCETESWEDVIFISAAGNHTLGLTSKGQILAVGDVSSFSFSGWTDIIAIDTGLYHAVGLRKDGSVVATGHESAGQCEVWKWHDIVEIAAGAFATAAVTSEGKVMCTHDSHVNSMHYLDTSEWKLFEPTNPADTFTRVNRYETVRKEFLSLLLLAKENTLQFTINAYPVTQVLDSQNIESEKKLAQKANQHVSKLYVISKQIEELHEQYKPLKPLTDLMFQYSAAFCDLYSSLTEETVLEDKVYTTGKNTKKALEQFSIEIQTIRTQLQEINS